jgi:hypothetical protein
VSRLALGSTQPPNPKSTRASFPSGKAAGQGVKLTTHLHLVPSFTFIRPHITALCLGKHRDNSAFTFCLLCIPNYGASTASRPALGPTQPPNQWAPGALSVAVSGGVVKLTTDLHLVPKSKNAWSYISTPHYAFMAWCSVKKRRDNFTFTLTRKVYAKYLAKTETLETVSDRGGGDNGKKGARKCQMRRATLPTAPVDVTL